MPRFQIVVASALAMSLVVVGCKKEEATPTPPKADSTVTSPDNALAKGRSQAEGVASQLSGAGKSAGTAAQQDATAAADSARATAGSAIDAAKDAAAKLESVKQFISEKRLDEADKVLKAIEEKKDQLPEQVKEQLANVRKSLDTARAALAAPGK